MLHCSFRQFATVAVVAASLFVSLPAMSALVYVDSNSTAEWPGVAPVRTSALQTQGSRGVRTDRIHAQSFQLTSPIDVDRIYIGYEWISTVNFNTSVRIVEVADVFAASYVPGNVLAATVLVPPTAQPNPGSAPVIDAIELKWDASLSGGSPLTLSPRSGNEGYALEVIGGGTGAGTSPIAMIHRQITGGGTYPLGRAWEMQGGNPAQMTADHDFVVAINAVPEPGAAWLGVVCCVGMINWRFGRPRVAASA
jgi:hypothetical protein